MGVKKMKIICIIIAMLLPQLTTNALGYTYEKKLANSKVIHIVHLDQSEYEAEIIKANNGNIGRETVSSIAQKSSANIAINGGFFEIGGKNDGKASRSLVIHGKVYGLKKLIQPLVIIKNGIITINQSDPVNYKNQDISFVSGIPMLIDNGKISEELLNKKSEFYTRPHARTALGIDSNRKMRVFTIR
ncbi:phosphodiester glycosidase family protein [Candidatus Lariskella endosymbiont of Hedychridium roseum]|uniref:phosphodiester glycosidase family protein n=1 Tax=Candidatus Lariskella endosymbiont of Hedychridium roseum TaxID=3077949 RepID=UPI0030CE50CF